MAALTPASLPNAFLVTSKIAVPGLPSGAHRIFGLHPPLGHGDYGLHLPKRGEEFLAQRIVELVLGGALQRAGAA